MLKVTRGSIIRFFLFTKVFFYFSKNYLSTSLFFLFPNFDAPIFYNFPRTNTRIKEIASNAKLNFVNLRKNFNYENLIILKFF